MYTHACTHSQHTRTTCTHALFPPIVHGISGIFCTSLLLSWCSNVPCFCLDEFWHPINTMDTLTQASTDHISNIEGGIGTQTASKECKCPQEYHYCNQGCSCHRRCRRVCTGHVRNFLPQCQLKVQRVAILPVCATQNLSCCCPEIVIAWMTSDLDD